MLHVRSYIFLLIIYLLNIVVVLRLHVFSFFAPRKLLLVLTLLLILQLILQLVDLVRQLLLILIVRRSILLDRIRCLQHVLLQFVSLVLGFLEITAGILNILQVLVHDGALGVEREDCRLEPIDLDFLFGHLHRHHMLLVVQHVLVLGRCDVWRDVGLDLFRTFVR